MQAAGCVPGTEADAERIPPAVAAHAIATYTHPGDLVLDPDCGTGTVLTEALRAGRHALGLTTNNRWWTVARANLTAAKSAGAWRDGSVLDARPKVLATARAVGLTGRVGLVLTALRTTSNNPNSPDHDPVESAAQLATTLRCCEPLLRAGGHVVVIAQPHRRSDGSLVDLTTQLIAAGTAAGLTPVHRCVALTAELRGDRLITRASLVERRAARATVSPALLAAHHEVLVFQLAHDAELAAANAIDTSPVADDGSGFRVTQPSCPEEQRQEATHAC
ncbi:DNA methyltransferase [Lentzea sp. BCCO 10_0856]|uniref:DNA methyltransferase n=1 Tax=Lentzea miocenica TaxID=3095431 RepID=A0ABU4T0U0_9PSEU|nr:DNA methyltransferase [Lentzea sp. BCCO 10_0856]MDX8031689.1 DNA methyltransferase [Lentzea sp. BCCO 10_0856]